MGEGVVPATGGAVAFGLGDAISLTFTWRFVVGAGALAPGVGFVSDFTEFKLAGSSPLLFGNGACEARATVALLSLS